MSRTNRFRLGIIFSAVAAAISFSFTACGPINTVPRPTLNEVRLGNTRAPTTDDTSLRTGENQAEVAEIDQARREIVVRTDDGRRQALPYDINATKVTYHDREYTVDSLEAGDLIAYRSVPRNSGYVETIRIQEPVQARTGRPVAGRAALPPRTNVVEGTVERIQYDLGVFDVRPRTGNPVTVSVPYNARPGDVDNFRRLRRGDEVRVEGEFVNRDNFQLISFLSPRSR